MFFLLTKYRVRRLQDRWVLALNKLPAKESHVLSITNTKSTKTVIEMRSNIDHTNNDKDFQLLEECMELVRDQLVSVNKIHTLSPKNALHALQFIGWPDLALFSQVWF